MDAFKIIYNGVPLDVEEGATLAVEFVSAIFNEEKILGGSFSYPVKLKLTDRNKNVMGQAHLLENRLARKSLDVDVELLGMSWKRANLVFDVEGGYSARLMIDVATVAEWMRDRALNSAFTVSNNGNFVRHIGISLGATNQELLANIFKSVDEVGSLPYTFYTYRNEGVFGEGERSDGLKGGVINEFGQASGMLVLSTTGMYNPSLYLTWVIKEVCKFLGFEARGSFLEDDWVRSLVIYNTGMVNKTLREDRVIYPAQHLPGISVGTFFKTLRNDMRVGIYFDSLTRMAWFELPDNVLGSRPDMTPVDLTRDVVAASVKIETNDVTGYMLKANVDDGDNVYKITPYAKTYVIGEEGSMKNVDMGIGTVFMKNNSTAYGWTNLYLPHVQQLGNFYDLEYSNVDEVYNPPNSYGKNEFSLRLLSHKGAIRKKLTSLVTIIIPYATSDDKNLSGDKVYDISLQPGADNGYLSILCLRWYNYLLSTEKVTAKAMMDINQFMLMNPLRKILLPGDMKGVIECLMDKVVFSPKGGSREIAANLTLYPNYNIESVLNMTPIRVVEGEVAKPIEDIYVRLDWTTNKRLTVDKKKEKWEQTDLIAYFYKDIHGSIPTKVENLTIYVLAEKRGDETSTGRMFFTVTANGSAVLARDRVTYQYRKEGLFGWFGTFRIWVEYFLDASPTNSYKIIK